MFSVVAMEIGAEFLFAFAIARRDVRGLATVHRILEQARLGYISIAVFFVAGPILWPKVLLPLGAKAVEADAGQRPVEDVVREMAASHAVRWFMVIATIFVLIILDMVLKPF
jgi:hypothetical protein